MYYVYIHRIEPKADNRLAVTNRVYRLITRSHSRFHGSPAFAQLAVIGDGSRPDAKREREMIDRVTPEM